MSATDPRQLGSSAARDPVISVVVPTRDRPEMLARCLMALRATLAAADEIIVVDSASRGEATRRAAEAAGTLYIRCEVPGTSLARNVGWRAAAHDVVAFVDDDIRVSAGWADAARQCLALRAEVEWLTGSVHVPPEQAGTDFPSAVEERTDAFEFDRLAARAPGISGNLFVRRGALKRVGGFDERLGPGRWLRAAEDKDLFDRLLAAGCRGRYEPEITVSHEQWRTKKERLRLDWSYGIGAGARLAKLVRTDRRRLPGVARDLVMRWGFGDLARCLRQRYEFGAAAALLRLAGMLVGFVTAIPVPVREGHFRRALDSPDD